MHDAIGSLLAMLSQVTLTAQLNRPLSTIHVRQMNFC